MSQPEQIPVPGRGLLQDAARWQGRRIGLAHALGAGDQAAAAQGLGIEAPISQSLDAGGQLRLQRLETGVGAILGGERELLDNPRLDRPGHGFSVRCSPGVRRGCAVYVCGTY